jgi:hypothetical protein
MSEPPGVPSVLGIESVQWLAEGGENLTVRVTGRWRRRRPGWSVQPVLVVEAAGRRFRFPAAPEPPSLSGAGPGLWRISFSVPAALAPELGGRTWLQVGAVVIPLPAADTPVTDSSGGEPGPASPAAAEDRQADGEQAAVSPPSPELEVEDARRRAREAEEAAREAEEEVEGLASRVRGLEEELSEARAQAERLSDQVGEADRSRRTAEQRAHSEQALRRDLARRLAAGDRSGERARAKVALADERIGELERELREARRREDEAQQLAAAARAARQRAEQRAESAESAERTSTSVPEPVAPSAKAETKSPSSTSGAALRLERGLVAREAQRRTHVLDEPVPLPAAPPRLQEAPAGRPADETLVSALRHELEARAAAGAALRARLVEAEAKLGARTMLEQRTSKLVGQLRDELDGLRRAFARERGARRDAERRAAQLVGELDERRRRTHEAQAAIAELREALEGLRRLRTAQPRVPPVAQAGEPAVPAAVQAAESTAPPGGHAGSEQPAVEPERLNDARQRLRESVALPEEPGPIPDAERAGRAWLAPIWTALAVRDPDLAGRLLVELLPAQGEALRERDMLARGGGVPPRLAYDLVFTPPRGCARVTVTEESVTVSHAGSPRPAGEVDLQVLGDPAALVRLLTAGPLRRRFGRGVARVRGRRDRLAALRALPAVRLKLRGLHRLGVRLEPELALVLAALMIDPAWTAKESFAIGYLGEGRPPVYLLIRDGDPPAVTGEAPATGVVATIAGPADAAALALSGEHVAEVKVSGEEWPLALVRKWIKRAQSG